MGCGGSKGQESSRAKAAMPGLAEPQLGVHVDVRVVPGKEEDFVAATLENCANSLMEPAISQFELSRRKDDPARFTLVEVYSDETGPAAHKATAHYQKWRDAVAGWMAAPRASAKHDVYAATSTKKRQPAAAARPGSGHASEDTGHWLGVHVDIQVRPENVGEFVEATLANCASSIREEHVAQFELNRRRDDPARFTLVEVYSDPAGPAAHKATAHYQKWRDAVAGWMAAPRASAKHDVLPVAMSKL